MTSWNALGDLQTILINYYFGSPFLYYMGLTILFFLSLIFAGVDERLALFFSFPLIAAFLLAGVLGGASWIVYVVMIAVGIIYAYAVIDIFT